MLYSIGPIDDSSGYLHTTFYLALMFKPPGIMQRVTKSQKVHISSHDYKHFIPSTLVNMSQGFPGRV